MEFGKDNESHSNIIVDLIASERTANHSANCEVPGSGIIIIIKEQTEARVVNSVTVEMAPSTDDKKVPAASDQSPTEDAKEQKGNKHKHRKEKPKDVVTFKTHLTTLAHLSVLVFVYMVVKLALRGEFVFFTWHPILMSVGWMFLMTEGFFAINKNNTYWRFKTKGEFRVKIHAIFLGIGYALSIGGFVIVFINKNNDNKPHFVTWHGLFGVIAIVCTFLPVLNGTLLWYKKEMAWMIHNPRLLKFGHVLSGSLTFSFGALSLILGVYSRWFAKKSDRSDYIFYAALISVTYPLFWAVYGPAVKLTNVVKDYFSEEKEE